MRSLIPASLALALALAPIQAKTMISKKPFGKTQDGTAVDIYTLQNGKLEATITNYGGRVVTLKVPDRAGNVADIVLGFDSLDGYLQENPYFGALIGRYGNRIGHAKFSLDGHAYTLPKNDAANTLHGGIKGFDKHVWTAHPEGESLVLTYVSKDGEEGFPGTLSTTVKYSHRKRTPDRIHSHHRQEHRSQSHQPFLFQPGRTRAGRCLEA